MVRLFTAGGVIVDTVVAADGTLGPQTMGGNAVYSAAGARLWLDRVGIAARVPSSYPRTFLDRLAATGIDITGVRSEAEAVAQCEWFFYRPDGSRADHLHAALDARPPVEPGARLGPKERAALEAHLRAAHGTGSTFSAFRRRHPVRMEDVPRPYLAADAAHLAANRPAQQAAMARALAGAGLVVSLDPGSNAAQIGSTMLPDILAAASAFLPSEKELRELVPGQELEAALLALRREGPAHLAAKLGEAGSLILGPEGDPVALPAFATRALDPTGAGDAYCGGFLAGLLLTGNPLLAACLGTVAASFAVEAFGPFHIAEMPRAAAHTRLRAFLDTLDPALAARLRAPFSLLDAA